MSELRLCSPGAYKHLRDVQRMRRMGVTALITEAAHNSRVQVSLWQEHKLVKVAYEGPEENTTMKSLKDTVSGVCPKCNLIGVSIVNGKVQAHANGCDGTPKAAAPRAAFVPRCVCDNNGTCRSCKIADGIVQAFFALRSPAARGIGAPAVQALAPLVSTAPATVVSRPAMARIAAMGAPSAAARTAARAVTAASCAATMGSSELLALNVQIACGVVEAFQALRDGAHLQPAAQLACSRCKVTARMGYILDGAIVCRDCRPAHREAYYASRGQVATPRTARRFSRGARVATMTVHADSVTVAS